MKDNHWYQFRMYIIYVSIINLKYDCWVQPQTGSDFKPFDYKPHETLRRTLQRPKKGTICGSMSLNPGNPYDTPYLTPFKEFRL